MLAFSPLSLFWNYHSDKKCMTLLCGSAIHCSFWIVSTHRVNSTFDSHTFVIEMFLEKRYVTLKHVCFDMVDWLLRKAHRWVGGYRKYGFQMHITNVVYQQFPFRPIHVASICFPRLLLFLHVVSCLFTSFSLNSPFFLYYFHDKRTLVRTRFNTGTLKQRVWG